MAVTGCGPAVPYLTEVAIVRGVSAHVIDRVLSAPNTAKVLDGLPGWLRLELDATRAAIHRAAEAYEAGPVADLGSSATPTAAVDASSPHDEISTGEAAVILGLRERRVRQLAGGGMGRKVGHVWLLDRSAVLAYREFRCRAVS